MCSMSEYTSFSIASGFRFNIGTLPVARIPAGFASATKDEGADGRSRIVFSFEIILLKAEVKDKLVLGSSNEERLYNMGERFHACRLEKRFWGNKKTRFLRTSGSIKTDGLNYGLLFTVRPSSSQFMDPPKRAIPFQHIERTRWVSTN